MAYQTRGRDPLLDSNMAQAIEKRGKELLGLALLGVAVLCAMLFASYSPDDPSWLSAVDTPPRNWLGQAGATIAATLIMVIGWAGWGVAIVLAAWGLRFVLHRGQERAMSRAIFAPIWVAVLSLYTASLTPGAEWYASHSFGLGGIFGDTILGAILGILPMGAAAGLKLLSLILALVILALGAFVTGFEMDEIKRGLRYVAMGIVAAYAGLLMLATRGATAAKAARSSAIARSDARISRAAGPDNFEGEDNAAPAPHISRHAHTKVYDAATAPDLRAPQRSSDKQPEKQGSLLGRMPSLMRKPEPVLTAAPIPPEPSAAEHIHPGEDRIKAKIADIIRSRVRGAARCRCCWTQPARRSFHPSRR